MATLLTIKYFTGGKNILTSGKIISLVVKLI